MRITLAQVDAKLGDVDANIQQASEVVARAKEESTELIVFPELYLSGYSVGTIDDDVAVRVDDPRLVELARQAARQVPHRLRRVGQAQPAHVQQRRSLRGRERLVHVHRKLHLPTYSVFEERKHFTPGPSLRAHSVGDDVSMATLICGDAWQPQLAFIATQDGAQAPIVPAVGAQSRFPEHYDAQDYWHGITRFYGRMYQLYVVFVNRVGVEGELTFWGGSHVVDPWGKVIVQAAEFDPSSKRAATSSPAPTDPPSGAMCRPARRVAQCLGDSTAGGDTLRHSASELRH